MIRLLRWYDKGTEQLAGDRVIHAEDKVHDEGELYHLQMLYKCLQSDPMVDVYPVTTYHEVMYVRSQVGEIPIDMTQYDYFIEVDEG